jgi:DNA polymerase-4
MAGRAVTLKLKTADFKIITRTRSLASPTQRQDLILEAARQLLAKETDGRRFRLVGVGLGALGPEADADPPGLFD